MNGLPIGRTLGATSCQVVKKEIYKQACGWLPRTQSLVTNVKGRVFNHGFHALFIRHFHLAATWKALALVSMLLSCTAYFDSVIYCPPFSDPPWAWEQIDKQSVWPREKLGKVG